MAPTALLSVRNVVTLLSLAHGAWSHGCLVVPRERGAFCSFGKCRREGFSCSNSPFPCDEHIHYPSGIRGVGNGGNLAILSQKENAGSKGWTLFEPESPDFVPRAGVCGDMLPKSEHMRKHSQAPGDHERGGKYYAEGLISNVYQEGGYIDLEMRMAAGHRGFVEVHVCDVEKGDGEISWDLFRQGHCHKLQRAVVDRCESGTDDRCLPIDNKYPGRWYFPCYKRPSQIFGEDGTMRYVLPKGLNCRHCVLHFYWVNGNPCTPPGVREYFQEGRGGANMGECPAGSVFPKAYWGKDCGGKARNNPEEYYKCADIAIASSGISSPVTLDVCGGESVDDLSAMFAPTSPVSSSKASIPNSATEGPASGGVFPASYDGPIVPVAREEPAWNNTTPESANDGPAAESTESASLPEVSSEPSSGMPASYEPVRGAGCPAVPAA